MDVSHINDIRGRAAAFGCALLAGASADRAPM